MQTVAEIKHAADALLFADAYEDALRLYLQLLEAQPLNLDARLRVGDALLALGEVQRAAVVYTRLAQYATNAGYPLRALSALKILSALEPGLSGLVREVASVYGRDSQRLGRGARRSLPSENEPLPRGSLAPSAGRDQLLVDAEHVASDYAHAEALFPEKLMPMLLLSQLDGDQLARVFAACTLVRARPGKVIVEQGSRGDSMYVLARGSVRVLRTNDDGTQQVLASLHEGAVFGELSLLSGAPRNASVVALDDCDLLSISRTALAGEDEAQAQLFRVVAAFAHERLLAYVMAHSTLFAALAPAQRLDLIKRFVEAQAKKDTRIVKQGDPGQGAYVVLRGQVRVSRRDGDEELELARLGPGELFGEMSLLSGQGANADVRALEDTSLLFLSKVYFDRLLDALPELRDELELLADRRSRASATLMAARVADDDSIEVEVLL